MAQFWKFFASSFAGLAIDLVMFWLLSTYFLSPGVANIISSMTSIITVYIFSSKFAFNEKLNWANFAIFAAWYSLNIVFFSWLIQAIVDGYGIATMLAKMGSVPISFLLNFLFNKFLFRKRK